MENLVQISSVKVNENLSKEEKLADYLKQIKNPYCYMDGDIKVNIVFSDTEITFEEALKNYLQGL